MGSGNADAHQATMYLIVLIVAILSFSFNEPEDARWWHLFQYISILLVIAGWAYMTMKMNEPTEAAQQEQQAKLNEAISLAGTETGVSQEWWDTVGNYLSKISLIVIVWISSAILHSIYFAYPNSIYEYFSIILTDYWHYILDNYSQKTIFIVGVFGSEFVTYWAFGLIYAFLDLTRPSLILPFKVQQDWSLTWEQFKKAAWMGLRNQLIVLAVVYVIWDIYPLLAPNGFSRDLPSIYDFVISMIIFQPFGEIWFYSNHRIMHKYDWLWSHIHYIHHEWTAPIALTCVYAHWFEHLWINVVTVMIGPFLMGSHVSIWIVYASLAIANTAHAHSGWHVPFFSSPEGHDYHHYTTEDNYGVIGVLDYFFGTNSDYLASWHSLVSKVYTNQEYPVDKILAANGDLSSNSSVSQSKNATVSDKSKENMKSKVINKEKREKKKKEKKLKRKKRKEALARNKRKKKNVQISIGDLAVDSLKLNRKSQSKTKRKVSKTNSKESHYPSDSKHSNNVSNVCEETSNDAKRWNITNKSDVCIESDMEICDTSEYEEIESVSSINSKENTPALPSLSLKGVAADSCNDIAIFKLS